MNRRTSSKTLDHLSDGDHELGWSSVLDAEDARRFLDVYDEELDIESDDDGLFSDEKWQRLWRPRRDGIYYND